MLRQKYDFTVLQDMSRASLQFKGEDRDDPEFVYIVNQFFISDERINEIRSETQKDQSL